MPILFWVIVGIVAFDLLFVAVRLWATREPRPRRHPRTAFVPIYATVGARQDPHRRGHRRRRLVI